MADSHIMSGAPRRVSWIRVLVLTVTLLWGASVVAVFAWGRYDGAEPSDTIVVLGAAQYAGRPSPVLRARLDHALGLYQRGLAKRMLLTGGIGPGDTTSEAAVGRRYVMQHGVPDSAILLETEGRSTNASLRGVAAIMRGHDLQRAILVSDPFHMLRLLILARRHGIDAVTSPTQTSPISANPRQALAYVMSESVKVPLSFALSLDGE